jgi:hypothetical protein
MSLRIYIGGMWRIYTDEADAGFANAESDVPCEAAPQRLSRAEVQPISFESGYRETPSGDYFM